MRAEEPLKRSGRLRCLLLIFIIVTANMVIVLPLSSPRVSAFGHLPQAAAEDGDWRYDADVVVNNNVIWYDPGMSGEDHIFTANYIIDAGYNVSIPGMYFIKDPGDDGSIIYFMPGFASRIDVYGTLITNERIDAPFGDDVSKTVFMSKNKPWDGIYFHRNCQGRIIDCRIRGSAEGVVFEPGSIMIAPGIQATIFDEMCGNGVQIDGATGHTYMSNCWFDDRIYNASVGLTVANGSLNVSDCRFWSHGENKSQVVISNADVRISDTQFWGYKKPGNLVFIEGDSDSTVLDWCFFKDGAAGDHFIRVDGASPLISNCTIRTKDGSLSVIANDDSNGVPAHPILLQPNWDGFPGMYDDSFDNTTIDATGDSSVTIQWYMDVFVQDPHGNPIGHAWVWVKDRNGDSADPALAITDANGWARWIKCKELTKYSTDITYYSPFNVTVTANGMMGYADPEVTMNVSKEVVVTVPFNPSNSLPSVTWITTPVGVQTGYVTINYQLFDPDPADDGNLSVEVFFTRDGKLWKPATLGSGSSQTTFLSINKTYTVVWDSEADMPGEYNTNVSILILPSDGSGQGTSDKTGKFTVDNKAPEIILGPFFTPTNTTALIEWTADEPSTATVSYGLWGAPLSNEIYNTSWTAYQTVNLTGLEPGRLYHYTIKLADIFGHEFISQEYSFETQIRIPLYKGWNMISLPPFLSDFTVEDVLAPIEGQYDIVQVYDASDPTDPWKCYNIHKPEEFNDLHEIKSFKGLWVHVLNDTVLIPDHRDPSFDPMFPGTYIRLFQGWNYVGYPSVKTRTVSDALSGVPYDIVQTYDALTEKWWSSSNGNSAGTICWEMSGLNKPFDAERLTNGNTLIVDSGNNRVIEVDSTGTIVWEYGGLDYPTDAERLENGNTLIAEYGTIFTSGRIIELDSGNNIVWEYNCDYNPFDVERLDNGNTLITEVVLVSNWGRVIEVNSINSIVWQTQLGGSLMDAERLANGNTLIVDSGGKRVVEVDINGDEVWEWAVNKGPWDVERLDNGNTLICEWYRVVEIDSTGNIIWQLAGLNNCTDAEKLDNGNVLITERDNNRVFEIDCSCDLTKLEMGRGYWIHCSNDYDWHIDYV